MTSRPLSFFRDISHIPFRLYPISHLLGYLGIPSLVGYPSSVVLSLDSNMDKWDIRGRIWDLGCHLGS